MLRREWGKRALSLLTGMTVSMGKARAQVLPDWLHDAMRRLDSAPVLKGDFEQTKLIRGFKRPLVSTGHFVMANGRGVQWATQSPFPSMLVVTRERLLTITAGSTQQIDTRQEPGLRVVNELLMSVLAGDMRALNSRFQLEGGLRGAQGWYMTLMPRDAALARFIARIEMDGDHHVQNVRLSEASGDESHIRFSRQRAASLEQVELERFN